MKVSNLNMWQFVAIMVVILVGTSLIFRLVEKKIAKRKLEKTRKVPLPTADTSTGIDTSNGLVYRQGT